jgi:Barstar (barnase inhibitor)
MLIRIDARRLKDAAALHTTLGDAFGFFEGYGKNLDALVDCLTSLDNSKAALSRAQVFPGQIVLLVIEHTQGLNPAAAAQVKSLTDVVAFVNWRRWENKQPPILALAYEAA